MPAVLIPPSPGIFSATGLLTTDLKRDAARTIMRRLESLPVAEVESAFGELETHGAAELATEGVANDAIEFVRQIDMRYVGQSYELTIPAPSPFGREAIEPLLARFHAEHDRTYGFAAEEEPVECVSLRLTTVGRIAKPPLRTLPPGDPPEPKERREVYFSESGGYVDCPIYDRYALPAEAQIPGPAIVEEFDSTTVLHPGYAIRVDRNGNLMIERSAS
jgi:N-methylhydantoinase A